MTEPKPRFIPALNKKLLTPFYDPTLRYIMGEDDFKKRLIDQANPQPGERILDLGCGTGTLTIMLQRRQPTAEVVGLDGDTRVLDIAQKKAHKVGVASIRWDTGLADELPYPDESFDKVITSMMLHHLTLPEKLGAFQEVHRVLKPSGSIHIADFGKPHDSLMRFVASYMSHLERTAENFKGRIPELMADAGFEQVEETGHLRNFFGPLSFYRGLRKYQ